MGYTTLVYESFIFAASPYPGLPPMQCGNRALPIGDIGPPCRICARAAALGFAGARRLA